MTERTRLTLAVVVTCLLLAAVGVAGVLVQSHTAAPTAHASVPVTPQAAQTAPTSTGYGEHD
jgi:hypothetical protein